MTGDAMTQGAMTRASRAPRHAAGRARAGRRPNRRPASLLAAVLLAVPLAAPAPARADQDEAACPVAQAADAAVQRQIALIDAAKVNPSDFFSGPNACISTELLRQFDLSKLIPDLSGFLTSSATSLATQALSTARQKACDALNSQLGNLVGRINTSMAQFSSSLGPELSGLFNGNLSPLSMPNIPGIGQFNLAIPTGGEGLGAILAPALATPPQPALSPRPTGGLPQGAGPATPQTTPQTMPATPSGEAKPGDGLDFGKIFK